MAQEITLDASGRLVIPKDVRIQHRLSAGSRLTLITEQDRLVLVLQRTDLPLIEKDGLLVVTGTESSPIPDHRQLREGRRAALQGPALASR